LSFDFLSFDFDRSDEASDCPNKSRAGIMVPHGKPAKISRGLWNKIGRFPDTGRAGVLD